MFSFLRKKSLVKRAAFIGAVLVLLTGFLFVSCSGGNGDENDAQAPTISVQPQSASWDVRVDDTFDLTVTASVTDGGALSYQWFSNTTNSDSGGTAITTGTSNTLTIAKEDYTKIDNYFYVVVTNTNNSVSGTKTAAATSNVAVVSVDISYLHGTWSATNYVDFFIIDKTAKTLEYVSDSAAGSYAGNILEVAAELSDEKTSGVIYIQFTAKPEVYGTGEPVEGDYTGIYFDSVETTTSNGFYFPADEYWTPVTTSTLAEAKTTLSFANFETYVTSSIEYAKIEGENGGIHPNSLEGTWIDDYDTIFIITKTAIVSAMDYGGYAMPFFAGDIFKVETKSATEGYIVFRYVGTYGDDDLTGKYSVLYWKSLTADRVTMAIAGEDWYGTDSDAVEATVAAAENKYSSGNSDDFDFTDFDKQ